VVVKKLFNRYNRSVELKKLHNWQLGVSEAMDLQRRLAGQVSWSCGALTPRFIGGVDMSVARAEGMATGAVVVLEYPEFNVVETRVIREQIDFPYIPGLLSFREAPVILAACKELTISPDLVLVDGQGVAHPRRLGLASHLGLFLDTPTIGCAKSRLCGRHEMPGAEQGDYAELVDGDETIGVALRTREGTNPIYVSVGHKVDLNSAIYWVGECCRGYRLPEPTRLAHLAAGGNLKIGKQSVVSEKT